MKSDFTGGGLVSGGNAGIVKSIDSKRFSGIRRQRRKLIVLSGTVEMRSRCRRAAQIDYRALPFAPASDIAIVT